MNAPTGEHEFKATIAEDVYYPDHTRVTTPTFTHTKHAGKAAGDRCAISGQATGIEYHHMLCEDAFTDCIDWFTVRGVAVGEITQYPVLDPLTDLPTGEMYDVKHTLLWMLLQVSIARGFDWSAFDPAKPETFVDSAANMLVIHEKFHRAKGYGIHHETWPIWAMQGWPRAPGYVYSPDELASRHAVKT